MNLYKKFILFNRLTDMNSATTFTFGKNAERIFYLKRIPLFLIRLIKRKFQGFKRSQKFVKENYEIGRKSFLESKVWETTKSLDDFELIDFRSLQLNQNNIITCKIDGNLCRTDVHSFNKLINEKFYNIFHKFVQPSDTIVELGCGFGYRLFMLRKRKFNNKMEGFDQSVSGIQACKEINNFFQCNIDFNVLDLIYEFDSNLLRNKIVFTYHVFEQLKHYTENIIHNIIKGRPKEVLHFEPINELYRNNINELTCKLYLHYNDYQDKLLTILKKYEKIGLLKITHCYRLGYSENPYNETSFIRWIPLKIP